MHLIDYFYLRSIHLHWSLRHFPTFRAQPRGIGRILRGGWVGGGGRLHRQCKNSRANQDGFQITNVNNFVGYVPKASPPPWRCSWRSTLTLRKAPVRHWMDNGVRNSLELGFTFIAHCQRSLSRSHCQRSLFFSPETPPCWNSNHNLTFNLIFQPGTR